MPQLCTPYFHPELTQVTTFPRSTHKHKAASKPQIREYTLPLRAYPPHPTSIAAKGTLVKWYSCMDAETATSSCPPPARAAAAASAAANLMQLKARGVSLSASPLSLV